MNIQLSEFSVSDANLRRGRRPNDRGALSPEYWRQLGYDIEELSDAIRIHLPGGTVLYDRGNRLTLSRAGEPSDTEIRILVAAGKARGWTEIRFSGGTPEFQRRARVEALRQGYRLDQISLECEDGDPQPMSAAPMPQHIRRRLAHPAEPEPPSAPPSDAVLQPHAPGARP